MPSVRPKWTGSRPSESSTTCEPTLSWGSQPGKAQARGFACRGQGTKAGALPSENPPGRLVIYQGGRCSQGRTKGWASWVLTYGGAPVGLTPAALASSTPFPAGTGPCTVRQPAPDGPGLRTIGGGRADWAAHAPCVRPRTLGAGPRMRCAPRGGAVCLGGGATRLAPRAPKWLGPALAAETH